MKTIASIDEIRAEIGRRIAASNRAMAIAATRRFLCASILDDGVANWIAPVPAGAMRGCEGFLLDVVSTVWHDYDLPAQSLTDTVRELLSARKSPF